MREFDDPFLARVSDLWPKYGDALFIVVCVLALVLAFRLLFLFILSSPQTSRTQLGYCWSCGASIEEGGRIVALPDGRVYCSQRCERSP